AVCYRLPSSIRCLLDSAELLVLPATGRTVDFHHTITRALPGAPTKKQRDMLALLDLKTLPRVLNIRDQ
ncbi:hypothetical protein LI117_09830, partial [Sutterella wadsworthensis]|uniref:hypothetical protein n=1 Tax=Sutterella wadsworthensis TaxID=40545 RepID=UPI001D089AC0